MTQNEFTQRILDMQSSLYRIAYGIMKNQADCNDAIQETLLSAWNNKHRLRDVGKMKAWVIRILINTCYSQLKRQKRSRTVEPSIKQAYPPDSNHELHDAIAALEEKNRIVIILYYMEGYKIHEIAAMLQCPVGTVKSRLRKGKSCLRWALSSENQYAQGGKMHEKV